MGYRTITSHPKFDFDLASLPRKAVQQFLSMEITVSNTRDVINIELSFHFLQARNFFSF